MKATCNGGTTSTRTVKITPSAGASAYSSGNTYTAQSWTQAGDSIASTVYQYQASLTKSGNYTSSNIPAAGLSSGTQVATAVVQYRSVNTWSACSSVTYGSWTNSNSTYSVTMTGTNCTLNTASTGTFAASKSVYNGQTVYIKVGCNGGTTSTRTVKITPSGGATSPASSGHTFTAQS